MLTIRPACSKDAAEIAAIGTASYPEQYYESPENFESRLTGYPAGCFVADLDGLVGYIISFPYRLGSVCELNQPYTAEPEPDCYYIHDLCVLKEFRGRGIAKQLAERILELKWGVIGLVSVNGSGKFWRKLGFRGFAEIKYCGRKAEYMLLIREKLL